MVIFGMVIFRESMCLNFDDYHKEETKECVGNVAYNVVEIIKDPKRSGAPEIVIAQVLRSKHLLRLFCL